MSSNNPTRLNQPVVVDGSSIPAQQRPHLLMREDELLSRMFHDREETQSSYEPRSKIARPNNHPFDPPTFSSALSQTDTNYDQKNPIPQSSTAYPPNPYNRSGWSYCSNQSLWMPGFPHAIYGSARGNIVPLTNHTQYLSKQYLSETSLQIHERQLAILRSWNTNQPQISQTAAIHTPLEDHSQKGSDWNFAFDAYGESDSTFGVASTSDKPFPRPSHDSYIPDLIEPGPSNQSFSVLVPPTTYQQRQLPSHSLPTPSNRIPEQVDVEKEDHEEQSRPRDHSGIQMSGLTAPLPTEEWETNVEHEVNHEVNHEECCQGGDYEGDDQEGDDKEDDDCEVDQVEECWPRDHFEFKMSKLTEPLPREDWEVQDEEEEKEMPERNVQTSTPVSQGPGAQQPETEKRGPVEFKDAVDYVKKVKSRFQDKPEVYQQFLEILRKFQRESGPIQDVYAQMTELFSNSPDLVEDLKKFLPESAAAAKLIQIPEQDRNAQAESEQQQESDFEFVDADSTDDEFEEEQHGFIKIEARKGKQQPTQDFTSGTSSQEIRGAPVEPWTQSLLLLQGKIKPPHQNNVKSHQDFTEIPKSSRLPAMRPQTSERSHPHVELEDQERAYIAASQRNDRSIEARMESAKRASEIHKKRKGRGLRVTQEAVENEMYVEEDGSPVGRRPQTPERSHEEKQERACVAALTVTKEAVEKQQADYNTKLEAYLKHQLEIRRARGLGNSQPVGLGTPPGWGNSQPVGWGTPPETICPQSNVFSSSKEPEQAFISKAFEQRQRNRINAASQEGLTLLPGNLAKDSSGLLPGPLGIRSLPVRSSKTTPSEKFYSTDVARSKEEKETWDLKMNMPAGC